MRSGLAFPVMHDDGHVTLGFENSAVYQDACDAFEAAQRSIVATLPGSVFRYINSGMNVLGAVIRDQIERRGLPYHETLYGLLADRLGHGELPAFGRHGRQPDRLRRGLSPRCATTPSWACCICRTACGTASGCCRQGWADYALTATHTGTSYAACFRTNIERAVPRPAGRTPPGRRVRPTSGSSSCAATADRRGEQRDRSPDGHRGAEPRHRRRDRRSICYANRRKRP